MERTLVPMMKVTKKAMKVVMVGRTAKARKKKPRRRKRKRRVVRAAHEQKRRRQSPSRRTRRPRRVPALEEPTVDVDAVLSIYTSTALIPTDPRGVCGCHDSVPCTIMEVPCLKTNFDSKHSLRELDTVQIASA
jgi:hypothetical protein